MRNLGWPLVATLLALSSGCGKPSSSSSAHGPSSPAPAQLDTPSLTRDLVERLATTTVSVENPCTAGRWLLSALSHADGADRQRLLGRMNSLVAQADSSQYSGCLHELAAELIHYLPSAERRAAVDRELRVIEKNDESWVEKALILDELTGELDSEQARRLTQYAEAQTNCCVRLSVQTKLVQGGRFAGAMAAATANSCRECMNDDRLRLLPFVDAPTQGELLQPELQQLDSRPESWRAEQLYALANIAPFLDSARRRELMARAFRRMPQLGVEQAGWGELHPAAHYAFILEKLAPFITEELLPEALNAVPPEWPPEQRSAILDALGANLPADVRRRSLSKIVSALPGPTTSLHDVQARLTLAAELSAAEVPELIARFLELDPDPRIGAEVAARLIHVSHAENRAAFVQLFFQELERIEAPHDRGRALAAALEALN